MYHSTSIAKLSENQLRKLLKGEAVRIKVGNHHNIHLSVFQLKKLHSAHKKGKATTITFDPYQVSQHGSGIFGDIARKVYHAGKEFVKSHKGAIKHHAHKAVHKVSGYAHKKIDEIAGEGILSDIANVAAPIAGLFGLGVKKHITHLPIKTIGKKVRKPRKTGVKKGKGFFGNVGKALLKSAVPIIANEIGHKISGGAIKRRGRKPGPKKGTKRTTTRRSRKGGSLFPAGGALKAAGY